MKNIGKPNGNDKEAVSRRSSFTLIELLVVVSIILILLGMSMKVMSVINRRATVARTTWILEQVKNALGAYYATYGTYPPVVQGVRYVHEGIMPPPEDVLISADKAGWTTGLSYYIYYTAESAKWQHYLQGIGGSYYDAKTNLQVDSWHGDITNSVHSIWDAWDQELLYQSSGPDYQQFTLWSRGPNGVNENGGGDDIGVKWSE